MKLAWLFLLISLDPIAVALAEDSGSTGMEVIEGSVWYRERMALPPNAEIHVYLEDVARMDVPSEVIASTGSPDAIGSWAATSCVASTLHFKALASTRMACGEGMELEQQFLGLLGQITRFSLSGNSLSLYGGDEAPRLRFNAVASE